MTECDFLVIGAGVSGASAAAELAAFGTTVLLEAEQVPGYHSTGRSAALYTPNFGSPLVRRLNAAGHDFFSRPPEGFSDTPLLTPRQALTIARPGEESQLEAILAHASQAHPITRIRVEDAIHRAPVLRPDVIGAAILEPGVMDMDVAAIHQGFLRSFRRRGGELRCAAPVKTMKRDNGRWHVIAGSGHFTAGTIINAAGAWGDQIGQLAGARPVGLVAKRRTMIACESRAASAPHDMPLVEVAGDEAYFKPDAGRILASPGDETPVAPQDVQPEEWDIAVIMDWLNRHTILDVKRVSSSWAGLRSFVSDQAPVVGFDPVVENFFWLVGQGGYGIMLAPTLARLTVSLVIERRIPDILDASQISAEALSPSRFHGCQQD